MNHRITDHIWDLGTCISCLPLTRILSWTMPHTFINCLLGQWSGVQHKWYQGSMSCLIYFARVECKKDCLALWYKSKAGQETLVLISKNIIHETKAAALVTKVYSNQDTESISLLLTVRQISCYVQSLVHPYVRPQKNLVIPQKKGFFLVIVIPSASVERVYVSRHYKCPIFYTSIIFGN
jgi:hypothetical protein